MVRVTPFLPLISGAATLSAPTVTDHRQESYALLKGYAKRELLTCEQTYGANWIQCGAADSTYCYNPSEGQTCCAQDAGYCDAGTWCAPVAGFCCLNGEDAATCAQEAGFELPSSASSTTTAAAEVAVDTTVSSTTTTTRTSSTIIIAFDTTSTTLSPTTTGAAAPATAVSDAVQGGVTPCTTAGSGGGLTWSSIYPATATGFGAQLNGSSGTNSTAALPTPSYVQISVAKKEQWTFVWMTVAMGVVGIFMASC